MPAPQARMESLNELEPKVPIVISVQDLQALDRTDVVIADVRWYLDGRDGRKAYTDGHIPGAHFLDLEQDLSAPVVKGVTGMGLPTVAMGLLGGAQHVLRQHVSDGL